MGLHLVKLNVIDGEIGAMAFNWFNRQFNNQPSGGEKPPEEAAPAEAIPSSEAEGEAAADSAAAYLAWAKAAYKNIQQRQTEGEAASPGPSEGSAPGAEPVPEAVLEPTPEPAPTIEAATVEASPIEASPVEASGEPEGPPLAPPDESSVESVDSVDVAADRAEEPVASTEAAPVTAVTVAPEAAEADPLEASLAETTLEPAVQPSDAPVASVAPPEEAETVAFDRGAEADLESSQTGAIAEPIASSEPSAEEPASSAPLPFWAQAEAERQARLERLQAEAAASEPDESEQRVAAVAAESVEMPDMPLDESFLWSAQVLASQGRRPDQVDLEEITWLKRLRQGLDKTRRSLVNQLRAIVGQGPLNQDAVAEIEALLLQADVGVEATDHIISALQNKLRQEVLPPEQAIAYLKQLLREMLDNPGGQPYNPTFAPDKGTLNIWLITGVNGAGKTTTIGKLAHIAQKSGYACLIGAADTFRAAAVEQVKVWGQRSQVEVIANPGKNTDPAAVVFDAITAAQARGTELLLLDTAGRLQNKKNLMEELSKIRRIIDKKAPDAHIESLLVLDATLGQNGLRQAEVFSEVAKLSGVVLTKLDGTARGGIALAVVQQLGLPIRFIGAGEGIEDLRPFSSYEFVEALLSG